MKPLWVLVLFLSWPTFALAQDVTTAITGVTLHPGEGDPIEGATVLLRGDRIVAAGAGVAVPAGARQVDGKGQVLTAGFIAMETALGLVEIGLEASTRDQRPENNEDPIRAAFAAADGVNPRSTLIAVARSGGVTSAVSTPSGALIAGTSALIDLGDPSEPLAAETVALHIELDDGGVKQSGGGRPNAWTRLREALDDARLYSKNPGAFDRRAMRESTASRLDLEQLAAAISGRLPVIVRVSRARDIQRVLALAKQYGLTLILSGAEEGWVVADDIAAAKTPVIVVPMSNMPTLFSTLGARYDNAALLRQAGVSVIITTGGAHGVRTLRQEAGNAVARGMAWSDALRALTLEPARALGLQRDYGSVEAGKLANVVLWSGDPFELSSRPVAAWIRGHRTELTSRQTALFERYRTLPARP